MHTNNGNCEQCDEILNRYPNFNEELRTWFKALQVEHPDAHVSCGGRGKVDQEVCFQRGASKAHYGQSSHNYNCAQDLFQLKDGEAVWEQTWFDEVVKPNLYPFLKWYGAPDATFRELPHVEVASWRELVQNGSVFLVE